MLIQISKIVPNPFRRFDLYPIDKDEVERLVVSMDEVDFFRPIVRQVGDEYQLVFGHHRLAAFMRSGIPEINAELVDWTDDEMLAAMARENLVRHEDTAAARLDAVAAYAYRSSLWMLQRRNTPEMSGVQNTSSDASVRSKILNDGPGEDILYQEMNGIGQDEIIKRGKLQVAIAQLKQSGEMAKIVSRAYAAVEAARIAREERERKAAAEEQLRVKREAERVRNAAIAREAEERNAAEREKLRKERETFEAKDRETREAAAAKKRTEDEAAEEKRRLEREVLRKQQEIAALFDLRCVALFANSAQGEAFRKTITREGVKNIIKREEQFDIAKDIIERLGDAITSDRIRDFIEEIVTERIARFDDEANTRRGVTLAQQAVANALSTADKLQRELQDIINNRTTWAYKTSYPITATQLDKLMGLAKFIERLK